MKCNSEWIHGTISDEIRFREIVRDFRLEEKMSLVPYSILNTSESFS